MGEIEQRNATGLDVIASRINEEHRACTQAAISALEHAIRAGQMLLEAKAKAGHGNWLGWLDANFEGSRSTAHAYMKLARRQDELNSQRSGNLSIDGALRALAAPPDPEEPSPGRRESLADMEARAEAALSKAWTGALQMAEVLAEIHRQ